MVFDRNASERLRELKRKQRRIFFLKLSVFLVLFTGIIGGSIYLLRLPKLQITNVTVRGNVIIQEQDVASFVQNALAKPYLGIIPRTNMFLVPKRTLTESISEQFPRFKRVTIEQQKDRTLLITVLERESIYLWCVGAPGEPSTPDEPNPCYYVDDTGYVFSEAPYFSGTIYFKFFGELVDLGDTPVGAYVLSSDYFKQIIRFKESLEAISMKPTGFVTYDTGLVAFLFSSTFSDTQQKIIFSQENNIENIISNSISAITAEPLAGKLAKEFSQLEYIDLRYDNKVYYKFIDQTQVEKQNE